VQRTGTSLACYGALHLQFDFCHFPTDVPPLCGFLTQTFKHLPISFFWITDHQTSQTTFKHLKQFKPPSNISNQIKPNHTTQTKKNAKT
jgi:hypothetical protein